MAIINCKECGKEISDMAQTCPHCGAKTEKTKKKNKIIIIILSILIVTVIMTIASLFIIKKLNNKTNLRAYEVVEYLQKKNYEFTATKFNDTKYATYYIYVNNDKEKIAFQRIDNDILGTIYCWNKESINDEWTDIKRTEENDTTAKKKQYEAYQKWLNKLGLNDTQIIEALDSYKRNTIDYKIMY